jgi:hypothetical protein
MGSLLRTVGGMAFLFALFLPAVDGCGKEYTPYQIAEQAGAPFAYPVFGALLVYGIAVLVPPDFEKKVYRWSELFLLLATVGVAAGFATVMDALQRKGGTLLTSVWVHFAALGLIFLGCLLRLTGRRSSRER